MDAFFNNLGNTITGNKTLAGIIGVTIIICGTTIIVNAINKGCSMIIGNGSFSISNNQGGAIE